MTARAFAAFTLLATLAACGGGGGGGLPEPKFPKVTAEGVPPASFDAISGTTFPLQMARLHYTGGALPVAERETWGIRILSGTELLLITPGEEVAMSLVGSVFKGTGADGMEYYLESAGTGFDWSDLMQFSTGIGLNVMSVGGASFGFQTPDSAFDSLIASKASVNYAGGAALVVDDGMGLDTGIDGVTTLMVDFETGSVTGKVFSNADIEMSLVDGMIAGGGFAGTLALAGPEAVGVTLNSSGATGTFFGSGAEEIIGSFEGNATTPGGDAVFVGVFAAHN